MSLEIDPPTNAQLREVRALRKRDGISLASLPRTKEQANAEIQRYRTSRNDYVIRNRKGRMSPEKRYAEERQAEAEANLARLREEFYARERARRAK